MRMAELSAQSGVPVPTIKYYLREGLLPPGERTNPNQARYQASHVRRLKLVRALLEVGGLSIARVREVLDGIDGPAGIHRVLGVAQRAMAVSPGQVDEPSRAWAAERLARAANRRGWELKPGDPVVDNAVDTLADRVAEIDLAGVADLPDRESVVEAAVVGTVLGDALFSALRRLAQQHASAATFVDAGRSTTA
jgi:DNA-binding transcriptional MerR regulator